MNSFTYENPTKIHFGQRVINQLSIELDRLGARSILFVYGSGSIKENGIYDAVIEQLNTSDITIVEHAGVSGNPILSHVHEGIKKVREHQIDLIFGVGGGSVIDESKAIALGAIADCDVWEFFTKRQTPKAALPVVAVLTLPATGSEMNGITVITNETTDEKSALVAPGLLNPKVSFLDPETSFSLSEKQTAYACTDILSHLMEAYLTTSADRLIMQDHLIKGVARGVIESMELIQQNPQNYDARAAFMWGATLGWSGICQAGIPAWGLPCHAVEMPLSGVYNIAHGAGLSIVIPAWMRIVGDRHAHRILQFGRRILGIDAKTVTDVADALTTFYQSIGSPTSCIEAGLPEIDLERLTMLAHTAFTQRGIYDYTPETIRAIYQQSIRG